MVRVTIVIPTFNDDRAHLAQAVASAKSQTWSDVEVIVVDDGSTVPVKGFEGVMLVRQGNAGLPAARNAGVAAGTGELILPLDGDDWIEPQTVRALVEALTAAPDAVAAYPLVRRFGAKEGRQHAPTEVRLRDLAVTNQVVAASLFRRRDFERVGGYSQQHDVPEDWELWIKLLGDGGRMIQVPEAVLHYRLRPDSLNTRYHDPEAGLRRIAASAPGHLTDLYVAAVMQARNDRLELHDLRAFRNAWAPRLAPIFCVRSLYDRSRRFMSRV